MNSISIALILCDLSTGGLLPTYQLMRLTVETGMMPLSESVDATQCPKSVKNNVYTTMKGKLNQVPTLHERMRLIRFVTTCFAAKQEPTNDYPEALKLVLAMQALVDRGENLPDCILVPIG